MLLIKVLFIKVLLIKEKVCGEIQMLKTTSLSLDLRNHITKYGPAWRGRGTNNPYFKFKPDFLQSLVLIDPY